VQRIQPEIARNRRTRRGLCGHRRCAILIRLAESRRVDESERVRVVQQGIEDRSGVEHCDLVEVPVLRLEFLDVCRELGVVVCERRCDLFDCCWSLFDEQGGAVSRRDCQKQE